jgi:hypothetical protein
MLQWFQKASTTTVTNISIDTTKDIQEFEVSSLLANMSGCHLLAVTKKQHVTFILIINHVVTYCM